MKKLFILAVAIVVVFWHGHAHAAVSAACGLPDSKPLWIDYAEGSVGFRVAAFGKPGIVAATSGVAVPAQLRQAGAQTVYWHMKLGALVGTTTAPADPATITASVEKLFAQRRRLDRLRDAVHRAERAERGIDDDPVDGDELALPPEHPRRPARAPGEGRAAVPARQLVPVHRR